MRSSLRWGLGLALALSALSLWWGPKPAVVGASTRRIEPEQPLVALQSNAPVSSLPSTFRLPQEIPTLSLAAARVDPFAPLQPPAPKPALPAPVPVVAAPPPPPPPPPPMEYRFLGRMLTPGGQTRVFLIKGDQAVAVAKGDQLPDGFVVESVADDVIQLYYPALKSHVAVYVPPAQRGQ